MKANVTQMRQTDRNARRDNGFIREIAVINPSDGRAVLIARIYMPGSVAYCSLWIHGDKYARGQGKAGGYGYHKQSAALMDAIRDAGITLTGDVYGRDSKSDKPASISGVGDSAMVDACQAIARAMTGKRKFITHEAHA